MDEAPEVLAARKTLCNRMLATGLYLHRKGPYQYTVEPKALAKKYKALVDDFRVHREAIMALLESHIATEMFSHEPEVDLCPHCMQQIIWLDVDARKRRARHHPKNDRTTWCPGGDATEKTIKTLSLL